RQALGPVMGVVQISDIGTTSLGRSTTSLYRRSSAPDLKRTGSLPLEGLAPIPSDQTRRVPAGTGQPRERVVPVPRPDDGQRGAVLKEASKCHASFPLKCREPRASFCAITRRAFHDDRAEPGVDRW